MTTTAHQPTRTYRTLARINTTRTPSLSRFPKYEHFDAVIELSADTVKRLTEDEL